MIHAAAVRDDSPITACFIDGNTIGAIAVAPGSSSPTITAAAVVETPQLVEISERLRHPIFMDVYSILYTQPDVIKQAFCELFADQRFRNPIVGVFPAEKSTDMSLVGEATPAAVHARRRTMLRKIQASNPYFYPSVFSLGEFPLPDGRSVTRLFVIRLADMLSVAMQYEQLGHPFLGLVLQQRAASSLLMHLHKSSKEAATTFLDVGKLRTLYSTWLPQQVTVHNPIPVGLARDDMHYFSALPPSIPELRALADRVGGLLFPVDATPSPLFLTRRSTPQIDCTRFVVQISRFATRALERVPEQFGYGSQSAWTQYVGGRGAKVPGLLGYLESYTESKFRSLEEMPPEGIDIAPGVSWSDVSDTAPSFGAALAYFHRKESSFGFLLRENRTRRLRRANVLDVSELEDNILYVFERAYEQVI